MQERSDEPCGRAVAVVASRSALRELWGDAAVRDVEARLPADAYVDTVEGVLLAADWISERSITAWYVGVWHGPAMRDPARFRAFVRRGMEHGFGRIRRLLLRIATPEILLRRAAELWRYDHTHGELRAALEGTRGVLELRDHPWITDEISSLAFAEACRHILTLAGIRDATVSHATERDVLVVRLAWSG